MYMSFEDEKKKNKLVVDAVYEYIIRFQRVRGGGG